MPLSIRRWRFCCYVADAKMIIFFHFIFLPLFYYDIYYATLHFRCFSLRCWFHYYCRPLFSYAVTLPKIFDTWCHYFHYCHADAWYFSFWYISAAAYADTLSPFSSRFFSAFVYAWLLLLLPLIKIRHTHYYYFRFLHYFRWFLRCAAGIRLKILPPLRFSIIDSAYAMILWYYIITFLASWCALRWKRCARHWFSLLLPRYYDDIIAAFHYWFSLFWYFH